jgi:hypothetical protein
VGLAKRGDLKEARDTGAAGGVGLEHVHRPGLEHPAKVHQVVAVLPGRDFHPRRPAIA